MLCIILAVILILLIVSHRRSWFDSLYSEEKEVGDVTTIVPNTKYLLYSSGLWHIWSSDAVGVFKITCDANNATLFVPTNGKINNLPAAIGGLPAVNGYNEIFNSNSNVYVELVNLATAQATINANYKSCLSSKHDEEYCGNEFTPLN